MHTNFNVPFDILSSITAKYNADLTPCHIGVGEHGDNRGTSSIRGFRVQPIKRLICDATVSILSETPWEKTD